MHNIDIEISKSQTGNSGVERCVYTQTDTEILPVLGNTRVDTCSYDIQTQICNKQNFYISQTMCVQLSETYPWLFHTTGR